MAKPKKIPIEIQRQIKKYGKPWADLSDREKWYFRHKTRSRGHPVNAYIPYPREPNCYGNWDDDACGVCGQQYDSFVAGVNYDDGIELMLQYAKKENVLGGGYRSRGAVLYAMSVLKRQAFFMRHELGCCMPVGTMRDLEIGEQNFYFFPFPRIIWYLVQYGDQDKRSKKNIAEAQLIYDGIWKKIGEGATTLQELKEYRKRVRMLEKKYKYSEWWNQMIRGHKTKGKFFAQSEAIEEDEFIFPWETGQTYDTIEGEFPF